MINSFKSNRKYHLRTYKNCFVGREAVDYFIKKGYAADRQAAVAFGDNLLRKHYFHHVVLDHSFKDDYYFYRFLQDEDLSALTLNSGEGTYLSYPLLHLLLISSLLHNFTSSIQL